MKRQAAVLVFARLTNYGVMLLSPLFLVHLLTVEQFGEYREFMLYASILQWMAGFSINDSLLYFIPLRPDRVRAWLRSSIVLVAAVSLLLVGLILGADAASGGRLLGWFALPLAIYVLAFANFDFWEGWYLATGRTLRVLVYSTVRLVVRMTAVVIAAAVWRDVMVLVWVVVATECLRVAVSAAIWWWWDRRQESSRVRPSLVEQWRFCVSTGLSRLVVMFNRNIGAVLIARLLGPVALARFTVATYPEPALSAVSKSVFLVTLPELVRRRRTDDNGALDVWKRSVSWTCAGIFVLLAFMLVCAPDLILVAFGRDYVPAAPLLQAFVIVMARNCVDFPIPLQAIGETRPQLVSNLVGLVVNAIALVLLMPTWGALGVVFAFALSTLVEPLLLAPLVIRRYGQRLGTLLHWGELGKILLASVAAAASAEAMRGLSLPVIAYLLLAASAAGGAYVLVLVVLRSYCIKAAWRLIQSRLRPARSGT